MLSVVEKTKNRSLHIRNCGLADFQKILQLQHDLQEKRRTDEIPDTVLITEHPPVITLGARKNANILLADVGALTEKGIDVVSIRRGGGTTAHNPGQIVFYPILNLQQLGLGISEYIHKLEEIGIELLNHFGVNSRQRKDFPGLWMGKKKIASIGVRVSKFVTYHGMAINIQNDLSIFDYLVPCGLENIEMTSVLKETDKRHSMNTVVKILTDLLIKHFSNTKTTKHIQRTTNHEPRKLPPWLRRPLPAGHKYNQTDKVLNSLGLQTICTNANCPNRGECWSRGTATVLILGNICTRNCKFCSVSVGKPAPPDPTEPDKLAEMAKQMGLKYLVITSVNRDDLADGGASHFRDCINIVRKKCPYIKFEILTPDFRNCQQNALDILSVALPFIFAHNVETVPSLYKIARAGGNYQRSLKLLKLAKKSLRIANNGEIITKSSIMLGLGETDEQVKQVLMDLREVGCSRITIGQYLKPSKDSLEVAEYVTPEKFEFWRQRALDLGFSWVISKPFARSSYFAELQNT